MATYHILPPAKRNEKKENESPRRTEIKKEEDDSEIFFSIEKLKEYSVEELNKHYKQLLYRQDDQSQHIVLTIHAELRERYEEIIKKGEEDKIDK